MVLRDAASKQYMFLVIGDDRNAFEQCVSQICCIQYLVNRSYYVDHAEFLNWHWKNQREYFIASAINFLVLTESWKIKVYVCIAAKMLSQLVWTQIHGFQWWHLYGLDVAIDLALFMLGASTEVRWWVVIEILICIGTLKSKLRLNPHHQLITEKGESASAMTDR